MTPTASTLAPAARSACSAPGIEHDASARPLPVPDPELERRLAGRASPVEAGASRARRRRSGRAPSAAWPDAITVGMPAPAASCAAAILLPMPPRPRPVPRAEPDVRRERAVVEQLRPRRSRSARVDAVDLGEQHEQPGVRQDGDLRRQRVVVAEGDLVGRRRVVLVHDRHRAEPEQRVEGVADVDVGLPVGDVGGREQDLRRLDADARERRAPRPRGAAPGRRPTRPGAGASPTAAARSRAAGTPSAIAPDETMQTGVAARDELGHLPSPSRRAARAARLPSSVATRLEPSLTTILTGVWVPSPTTRYWRSHRSR